MVTGWAVRTLLTKDYLDAGYPVCAPARGCIAPLAPPVIVPSSLKCLSDCFAAGLAAFSSHGQQSGSLTHQNKKIL